MGTDEQEGTNLLAEIASAEVDDLVAQFSARLDALRSCTGESCG
jgi:hypothetical protein